MPENTYRPLSIIQKKRDAQNLASGEIKFIIDQYTAGGIPDYQMSAFLMAAFINGLNGDETAAMTEAMLHSGHIIDLSEIPGKKVDKHSTGGVGDKLSLILAPIVASCGVNVPMISGRGLGHTGGTLDKLESIPGFSVDISLRKYHDILERHGFVMASATAEIAPADKVIYALRDVTATVESISFIASSIMSKKLSEGIDALVLDVKFGSGAFMKNQEDALKLAQTLVQIGSEFEKETIAYLSEMNQPLGYKIGNWLEVEEALDALQGNGPEDVMEVTHRLAGTMIYLGGEAKTIEDGIKKSKQAIINRKAWQKWLDLVEEQGGDISYLKNPEKQKRAGFKEEIAAQDRGYVQAIDAYKIGLASLELGAGRKTKEDEIEPFAGIHLHKKVGDSIESGEPLLTYFTDDQANFSAAKKLIHEAVSIGNAQPKSLPMVTHQVDSSGIEKLS
jgi:pyrimidine-nucleoside phosphorylase